MLLFISGKNGALDLLTCFEVPDEVIKDYFCFIIVYKTSTLGRGPVIKQKCYTRDLSSPIYLQDYCERPVLKMNLKPNMR